MLNLAWRCDSKYVQSILERKQNTYKNAFVCKMHMKRIPECTKGVWGGPWQGKWRNQLGWGWLLFLQEHLAT